MPDYRTTQPGQRQPMANPTHEKEHKSFHELLDCVSTDLFTGSAWHLRAANQMRKIGLRGFGRWHEQGSCHDHKKRICLEKFLIDRLDYIPNISISSAGDAVSLSMESAADIKPHLVHWLANEQEFFKVLAEAVRMAASVDMCVYEKLACILSGVENECMRIKFCMKRLELTNYGGHDLGIISMIIHDWLEKNEGNPDALDWNLG